MWFYSAAAYCCVILPHIALSFESADLSQALKNAAGPAQNPPFRDDRREYLGDPLTRHGLTNNGSTTPNGRRCRIVDSWGSCVSRGLLEMMCPSGQWASSDDCQAFEYCCNMAKIERPELLAANQQQAEMEFLTEGPFVESGGDAQADSFFVPTDPLPLTTNRKTFSLFPTRSSTSTVVLESGCY